MRHNCQPPITVFYDHSCPLCRTELDALDLPTRGFVLSDCSAPGFNDAAASACGITRRAMLSSLHLRDATGQWFKGIDAFEIIYRRSGHTRAANWLAQEKWRRFNERVYAWIARYKHIAARLRLHKSYGAMLRIFHRRVM